MLASSLRAAGRLSGSPGTLIGRTLARPTGRVDPSQQRRSLEAGAMSELQGIARYKFHDGKLEEFKRLSAQCMEIVRTKDTGTLQYDIYFNDDQSSASSSSGTRTPRRSSSTSRTLAT
jgi:hypothetical protein